MAAEKVEVVSGSPETGGSSSFEHFHGSWKSTDLRKSTDLSLSAQYSWLLKTAVILWFLIVATCAVGFVAGRYSVQLRVEVMPSDVNIAAPNINVAPAKVEVTASVPVPVVNIDNKIPQAPVVNIDNKIPPSTVNVLVDGRTTKVERIEEQKPVAPPVYKQRDPEGELLPPPKNLVK